MLYSCIMAPVQDVRGTCELDRKYNFTSENIVDIFYLPVVNYTHHVLNLNLCNVPH